MDRDVEADTTGRLASDDQPTREELLRRFADILALGVARVLAREAEAEEADEAR